MLQELSQSLLENKTLTIIIISLLLLSIICQIMIGVIYQKLINETDNLSTTDNKQLKLCKLKFQNCYQLNGNVPNIAVFVDKFISRLKVAHVSLSGLKLISLQLVMLSVFMSGVGACIGIINGDILFRILPFYLMALAGLYFYFSIASVVDIQGRKENLKINLIDYLENHMLNRLRNNLEINQDEEKSVDISKISQDQLNPDHEKDHTEPPQDNHKEEKPAAFAAFVEDFTAARFSREKELKATIAAFSEDEIEELLRELII